MSRKRHRIPTITYAGIQIREIRPQYWLIDLYRDGRRERKCFQNLDHAKTYCEVLSRKVTNEGLSALSLTPEQRIDAAKALAALKGTSSLYAAVLFWAKHHPVGKTVTLSELADRFLNAIRAAGCRKSTLSERGQKLKRLKHDLGDRPAAALTNDDIIAWMDSYKLTGSTRDGYRRCFRAMWQNGIREGVLQENIVTQIPAIRGDEKMPTPLTVDATRAILSAAIQYAPVMVPTLAVQFFGGLRPGEALGLHWQNIDFDERIIRVTPASSKVRRSRIIEMEPTLIDWLTPFRKTTGPIGITTKAQFGYYMQAKQCAKKKGLLGVSGVEWIQDGPRKTFASMHYAFHQDAAKLAAILGHTGGVDILFRHYRGLVKKTEAERYWKLRPPTTDSKVIQMPKAAG